MEIKIINFIVNESGLKKAQIDFVVTYSAEKWEIFRNVGYFQKDNKKWLAMPNVKRDEKWYPIYEREPSLKNVLEEALKLIKDYDIEQLKEKYVVRSESVF